MGDGGAGFNMADGYLMNRANKGYIGEYDFSISGNINDRVYLGLTFGIQDVHYKGYSEYTENLVSGVGNTSVGSLTVSDERTAKVINARLKELGREPVWKDWDASFDLFKKCV